MGITTASPTEVDTEIAQKKHGMSASQATVNIASAAIDRIRSSPYYVPQRDAATIDTHTATVVQANATIAALAEELAPLRAEFSRRGGWTRYYLVDAHNGHVHSSTHCSTCFPTPPSTG